MGENGVDAAVAHFPEPSDPFSSFVVRASSSETVGSCKMKRLGSALQMAVALVLLLALVGAAGWIVYTSITEAPVVVAAVVTGLLAILGLGVQRFFEQQREDARNRRERMAPIYEQLVAQIHLASDGAKDVDISSFFGELSQSLQLWGSPAVVQAFNTWRARTIEHGTLVENGEAGEDALVTMLLAYEDLLLVTRTDLGVSNDGLDSGDILRIFINDIDDHLPAASASL